MQTVMDYDRAQLVGDLKRAGLWSAIAIELVWIAVSESPLVDQDGLKRLVVRLSERALANRLRASKSGVHEAFGQLERRGLVTRGRGMYVVEWDAVCDLEPLDPLHDLPQPKRSVDGRSMVGSLEDTQEQEISSNQPTNPNQELGNSKRPTTDRPTRMAGRLPFVLRWRHLFGEDQALHRQGIVRLHRTCVGIGWIPGIDPLGEFVQTVGLVLWLNSRDRVESGIDHPLSWLIAAMRDGRDRMVSWPPDEFFDRAREIVGRQNGLLEELTDHEVEHAEATY